MVGRRGLGKGKGKGYRNLLFDDKKVHSDSAKGKKQPQTVKDLNINKYMGKWHEIARLPTWFQRDCKCAIAEYTKKNDYIEVKNSCLKDGERDFAYAKGYVVGDGKLEVDFNIFATGDYWVLHVDDNYNYALVGTPDRKYLWILARKPNISDKKFDELKNIAKKKGYDLSELQKNKGCKR